MNSPQSLVYPYQVGRWGEEFFFAQHKHKDTTLHRLEYHNPYDFEDVYLHYQIKTWPNTVFSKLNADDKITLIKDLAPDTRFVLYYEYNRQIEGVKEYLIQHGLKGENIFFIQIRHLLREIKASLADTFSNIASISYAVYNKNRIICYEDAIRLVERTIMIHMEKEWKQSFSYFSSNAFFSKIVKGFEATNVL